uniref:Uncharacterized protein n=1 Tax=Bombyx mori TaxID=7091 RepID=A0A8R2M0U9_BOMMO|nr:uncharacterized protein LOC105842934 isoform X1 [Bombyx mori]
MAQETVVLTTDSPPPASTPNLSRLLNSPSQKGQTLVSDPAQAEMSPSTLEQPINDIIVSPVSRRLGIEVTLEEASLRIPGRNLVSYLYSIAKPLFALTHYNQNNNQSLFYL